MSLKSFFSFLRSRTGKPRSPSPAPKSKLALFLEPLEDRFMPSCNSISGYVFEDYNNNGLFDPGEKPIANNPIELHNAAGTIIGRATTNSAGYYEFNTDSSIDTSIKTKTLAVDFADKKTNQTQVGSLNQFDPALGTLTSIDFIISGQITSRIKVENEDPSGQTITGIISGTLNVSGADFNTQVTTSSTSRLFNAAAWDGLNDFAGVSGKDFGAVSVPGSRSITLTSAAALADYTGPGVVTISETALANSTATGGGNLLAQIASTGSAHLQVVYHYRPENCLAPGTYTVCQAAEPAGYLNGKFSRNGVVVPPTTGQDCITVTLNGSDALHNDFGERIPTDDLSIVKSASPNPVFINGKVTYNLTVANNGLITGSNVVVKDVLPPGVTFVSAAGIGWSVTQIGGTVTATRASLAVGPTSLITITVKAPKTTGIITNVATVTSSTPDSDPSNNQSMATTQVISDIVISPDVFPPIPSQFPKPAELPLLSKLDFLATGAPANQDPILLAQVTYVDGLYRTLLGRAADFTGLVNNVKYLRMGGSSTQVVTNLWNSDEHLGRLVDQYYVNFLHHGADAGSRVQWIGVFRSGVSELEIARAFMRSAEYQAAHASDADFVTGLYADVLGRAVDAPSLVQWQAVLAGGASRDAVAFAILHSDEAYVKIIDSNYLNLLHRGADAGGRAAWLNVFRAGLVTPGGLSQTFLASAEFYNLAVKASQGL